MSSVLLLAAALLAATGPRPLVGGFFLGGIQINEPDHDAWAEALKAGGFDTCEVTVYARQGRWDSDDLAWSETDPGVLSEIRAAKRHGLRVVTILRVALDHAYAENRHLWHGQIYPAEPAQLEGWMARYRRFVLKWARISEREGVDLLVIGSELNALTTTGHQRDPMRRLARWQLEPGAQADFKARYARHEKLVQPEHLEGQGVTEFERLLPWLSDRIEAQRAWSRVVLHQASEKPNDAARDRKDRLDEAWRKIIRDTRAHFSGPVSYAANFDQYAAVGFWDALDFVGINAYFPLRQFTEPATQRVLLEGWQKVLETIHSDLKGLGVGSRPVVFTELGLTRRAGTTLAPWSMGGLELLVDGPRDRLYLPDQAPEDYRERARAIRALAEAAAESTLPLRGALWWKFTTKAYHRPHEPFALVLGEGDPVESALRLLAVEDGSPPKKRALQAGP